LQPGFSESFRLWDRTSCYAAKVVTLLFRPKTELSAETRRLRSGLGDSYVIDLSSGSIRMGGLAPVQWFVAQEGNNTSSDTVLVPTSSERDNFNKSDLADAAEDFIRISQWENPILFVRYSYPIMVTGTCEAIR